MAQGPKTLFDRMCACPVPLAPHLPWWAAPVLTRSVSMSGTRSAGDSLTLRDAMLSPAEGMQWVFRATEANAVLAPVD